SLRAPPFPYTTLFRSACASSQISRLETPDATGGSPSLSGVSSRSIQTICNEASSTPDGARPSRSAKTGSRAAPHTVATAASAERSEEHTSELQSRENL